MANSKKLWDFKSIGKNGGNVKRKEAAKMVFPNKFPKRFERNVVENNTPNKHGTALFDQIVEFRE